MTKRAKRGDTFALTVERKTGPTEDSPAFNITATTIAAKLRRGAFEFALTVTKTQPAEGVFVCSATPLQTRNWPPGLHRCDIEFTDGSDVQSSLTFEILVEEDVTY